MTRPENATRREEAAPPVPAAPPEAVVTSLVRHLAPRLSGEAASSMAFGFMRSVAARVGRPVEWDERADAPRVAAPLPARVRAALLQAAAHLDDPAAAATAGGGSGTGTGTGMGGVGTGGPGAEAWRAIDPEKDEAAQAARLMLRRTRFPHLLRSGEIFLPVGFDRPIDLLKTPIGATVLGSASRLQAELEQVRDEVKQAGPPSPAVDEALATLLRLAREAFERRLPLILAAPGG